MKKIILAALALSLGAAAPAYANMNHAKDGKAMEDAWFKKLDTNGDGVITKEEHDDFANKMFLDADTNGDGKITKDEMHAFKMKEHAKMKSSMSDKAPTNADTKTNSDTSK